MLDLTQVAIKGIEADDPEMFLAASEVVRAHNFGAGPNAGLVAPFDMILRDNPPGAEDVAAISSAVLRYLRNGGGPNSAAAVYILGSVRDPALIPVLRECLHSQLSLLLRQNQVLGNLICALANHGERIHSGGSYSLSEIDNNVADARA